MFHHVAWTRGTPYSTRGVSLGPDVLLLSYIFHALIIASTCIVTVMADHLCAHQLSRVPAWGTTVERKIAHSHRFLFLWLCVQPYE